MEANQKRLYEHFEKIMKEGKTDLIRDRAKRNADEILKSYPQFAKKKEEDKPEEKEPEKETKSNKRK